MKFQPYQGLDVDVVDTGAGDRAVLVLHGGSGPRGVASIVEHFAKDSRVLAPTHPGWDGTERPEWFTGLDSLATIYLDLLEDEKLHDVTVVASSFGGWVASEMAVRDRGGLIGRIVVLDGIGPEIDGFRIEAPRGGGRGPSESDIANMLAYTGTGMNDPKLMRRLARVTVPALFIWGEDDAVVPPEFGRRYADAFPDSRFVVVPDAGHMPALEQPKVTFGLIDDFV